MRNHESRLRDDNFLFNKTGTAPEVLPCYFLIWSVFNGTNVDFLLKNPDFLLKNPDFLLKNVDFLLKNPDFLLKNPDFLLKNVDLIIEQRWRAIRKSGTVLCGRATTGGASWQVRSYGVYT